jgi:hypothetical protein
MWFRETFGFDEVDRANVLSQIVEDGEYIVSRPTGRRFRRGTLGLPTLDALRRTASALTPAGEPTTLAQVFGDIREIHVHPESAGATFQVASQVNLLEMTSPKVTPDEGIDRYWHDKTQGPACAIACGAGTLHRNYLADVNGAKGQTADRQVDAFAGLAAALGLRVNVRNGYVWPTWDQLVDAARVITTATPSERDRLAGTLAIGVQADTEVTWRNAGHTVTQAYCSALPINYVSDLHGAPWEPLARLVLDAAYEATLCVAAITAERTGNPVAYLTRVGGGVFGNPVSWVDAAIERAMARAGGYGLQLRLVTYRSA